MTKIISRIRKSKGLLTAEGKIYDRAELFHSFIPGGIVGIFAGPEFLIAEMAVLESHKSKKGHLHDLEKNIMYHIAGYGLTHEGIPWLISLL